MSYNGWTNWETWQILLWADNEESTYFDTVKWCGQWVGNITLPNAGLVRDFFVDMFPNGTPDMDSVDDMDKVNWQEITVHIQDRIEELAEESD